MKKLLLCAIMLTLVFSLLSGCEQAGKTSWYNRPVGQEEFETLDDLQDLSGYARGYATEQALFDFADVVVVGMLDKTFTDGKIIRHDINGKPLPDGTADGAVSVGTLRDMTVLEVLKGDGVGDSLPYYELGCVSVQDGKRVLTGVPEDTFIAKQNVKYLFYLKYPESAGIPKDFLYRVADRGVVNIDGLDDNGSKKYIDRERFNETKEKYAWLFEKYDRSDERITEPVTPSVEVDVTDGVPEITDIFIGKVLSRSDFDGKLPDVFPEDLKLVHYTVEIGEALFSAYLEKGDVIDFVLADFDGLPELKTGTTYMMDGLLQPYDGKLVIFSGGYSLCETDQQGNLTPVWETAGTMTEGVTTVAGYMDNETVKDSTSFPVIIQSSVADFADSTVGGHTPEKLRELIIK